MSDKLKAFLLDPKNQWYIGRKAVEDQLIELRDARIGILGRNNGLVIKEVNGEDSHIIRLGPEMAFHTALKAMIKAFEEQT